MPSSVVPQGTDRAGTPRKLAGLVLRASSSGMRRGSFRLASTCATVGTEPGSTGVNSTSTLENTASMYAASAGPRQGSFFVRPAASVR